MHTHAPTKKHTRRNLGCKRRQPRFLILPPHTISPHPHPINLALEACTPHIYDAHTTHHHQYIHDWHLKQRGAGAVGSLLLLEAGSALLLQSQAKPAHVLS